jgi:hypothetical protein
MFGEYMPDALTDQGGSGDSTGGGDAVEGGGLRRLQPYEYLVACGITHHDIGIVTWCTTVV